MEYLSKEEFRLAFQKRLLDARESLGYTHEQMAKGLKISTAAYQKYETRPRSHFPLYLLPRLVDLTETSYSYWCTGMEGIRGRLQVITSR